jgi:hypothetical protein
MRVGSSRSMEGEDAKLDQAMKRCQESFLASCWKQVAGGSLVITRGEGEWNGE